MRTTTKNLSVVGLIFTACLNQAFANPTGGSVVGGGGNATITGQGTAFTTINQSANQVIINWQNFSIGAGEITRFIQPSATASALNRIISGNPSLIYGSLQANGRVFVINANGIIVGPSGQIDTKGFVASTLNVSDASFLAGGKLSFTGDSAANIKNYGTISALGGDVFLIANMVENNGTINAPKGMVGLAAGSTIQLVQSGNERLSVLAGNSSASGTPLGVNNIGTIDASSAELKAAGGNIYALAINNGGVIRATGIVNKNGHIFLAADGGNIQNSGTLSAQNANGSGGTIILDGGHNAADPSIVTSSGTIDASGTSAGTQGGLVEILGDNIGLFNNALADVSGDAGGGTALIGGDTHGANPGVLNAQQTTVDPGATINADARAAGNGGKVVVWADDTTIFGGSISARGGAASGNGGFAEVSGKQNLLITGHADLIAPNGLEGSLLLDPGSVSIKHEGSGNTPPNGTMNTFYDDWINGQLGLGSLTISTANSTDGNPEDLTMANTAAISWSTAFNLALIGNNSITIGGTIANSGSGSLTLTSEGTIAINKDLTTGAVSVHSGNITGTGNITFANGVTVSADSQTYWAGSGSGSAASVNLFNNNPKFLGAAGGSSSPVTFIDRQDASIAAGNIAAASQFGSSAIPGNYTIESDGGTVSISTASKVGGSALTLIANGLLTIGTSLAGGNSLVSLDATGNGITINTGGSATIQTTGADGQTYNSTLTLGGNTTLNGTILSLDGVTGGTHNLTLGNTGAATLNGAVSGVNQLTASGSGTLAVDNTISAGSFSDSEGTTLSGGTVTTSGGQTYNNAVTLAGVTTLHSTGNGNISLNSTVDADNTANNRTLAVNTGGTTTFGDAVGGVNQLAGLTVSGAVALNGGSVNTGTGSQTYNNAVTLGASVAEMLSGGNVTFGSTVGEASGQNNSLTVSGAVALNGGSVNTGTGSQTYNNAVTLGASVAEMLSGGNVTFGSTVGEASGQNNSLTVSGAVALNGGSVNTGTGSQTYNNAVTLGASVAEMLSGGNVTFGSTVGEASGQNNSLTVSGAVALNGGSVNTGTGSQTYNNAVTLGASVAEMLSGGNVTFGSTVGEASGQNNSLTVSGAVALNGGSVNTGTGSQTYNNAVTLGASVAEMLSGGNVTFGSTVGEASGQNNSLTVSGAVALNGGSVNTGTGSQTYNNAVTLGASVAEMLSGGNVTFGSTVGEASGQNNSLTVSGAVALNGGSVNTGTGSQTYNNAVTLGGVTTLTGVGVNLAGTVDGAGKKLTVNAGSGVLALGGNVGGGGALGTVALNSSGATTIGGTVNAASLTVSGAGGTTALDGGTVTTSGGQTYNNAVTLGGVTTLHSTGNGNISLNSTVDADNTANNRTLTVNTGGTTTFGGVVGGLDTLAGVMVDSGTLSVNSAMILASSGTVDLQLQANSAIDANITAGSVTVHSGLSGAGNITFGGGITVAADTQSYQAGDGHGGSGTGSTANLANNSPSFLNTAGLAAPNRFTYRQDATISSFPTASQFGGTVPAVYIVQSDDGGVNLASMTLPGTLQVLASGNISEAGPLDVVDLASFTSTGSGLNGNITLGADNTFGSLGLNSANGLQVSVTTTGNAALDNVTVNNGGLSINSGGAINQLAGRTINVSGLSSFTSTGSGSGGNIALNNAGNNFGSLALSSANGLAVSVAEASSTALDTVAVNAGTLDVISAGNIVQVGGRTIIVGSAANFTAPAGDSIDLGNSGNTFNGHVTFTGNGGHLHNVTIQDTTAFDLSALVLSGNLNVIAGGPITQSGALVINGAGSTATFATGSADDITLNDPNNDFTTVAISAGGGVAGHNVILDDINNLNLGNINISRNLTITAATRKSVTVIGHLLVGGTISINGDNSAKLVNSVAELTVVNIPTPKLDTINYASVSISLDEAAKILPPGSIGTLWMQLAFPPPENYDYKVEDMSKWTSGHLATAGGTTGPQSPR